jgi:hypothetical protein
LGKARDETPESQSTRIGGKEKEEKREEKGKKVDTSDRRCNCYLPKHILIPISVFHDKPIKYQDETRYISSCIWPH